LVDIERSVDEGSTRVEGSAGITDKMSREVCSMTGSAPVEIELGGTYEKTLVSAVAEFKGGGVEVSAVYGSAEGTPLNIDTGSVVSTGTLTGGVRNPIGFAGATRVVVEDATGIDIEVEGFEVPGVDIYDEDSVVSGYKVLAIERLDAGKFAWTGDVPGRAGRTVEAGGKVVIGRGLADS